MHQNFSVMNEQEPSCLLPDFTQFLSPTIHLCLAATFCVFGCFGNLIVIFILTRKVLFNASNCLLVAMSASQLVLLFSYTLFTTLRYFAEVACHPQLWSSFFIWLQLISNSTITLAHSTAVWLVVSLSVVRVIVLKPSNRHKRADIFTVRQAVFIVLVTILLVVLNCVPTSILVTVVPDVHGRRRSHCAQVVQALATNQSTDWYVMEVNAFGRSAPVYTQVADTVFVIACKIVPSLLVLVSCVVLVFQLRSIAATSSKLSSTGKLTKHRSTSSSSFYRSTRLIIVVMLLFVSVETPQALLMVYFTMFDYVSMLTCYEHIIELFEMMTVVYSSINFCIFCLMASQFRAHLQRMFRRHVDGRSVSQSSFHTTTFNHNVRRRERTSRFLEASSEEKSTLLVGRNMNLQNCLESEGLAMTISKRLSSSQSNAPSRTTMHGSVTKFQNSASAQMSSVVTVELDNQQGLILHSAEDTRDLEDINGDVFL